MTIGLAGTGTGIYMDFGQVEYARFPCPEAPGAYALELQVSPFIWRDKLTAQRIVVTVNDEGSGPLTSNTILS